MKWEQLIKKNCKKFELLGIDLRGVNSIKFCPTETLSHRAAKLMVCHLLSKAGHFFKTEQPINEAVCDIMDHAKCQKYFGDSGTGRELRRKFDFTFKCAR